MRALFFTILILSSVGCSKEPQFQSNIKGNWVFASKYGKESSYKNILNPCEKDNIWVFSDTDYVINYLGDKCKNYEVDYSTGYKISNDTLYTKDNTYPFYMINNIGEKEMNLWLLYNSISGTKDTVYFVYQRL